jgi:ElaB/YqjD/DUF883 family membrane-anchored ribosome-binding protein
MAQSGYPGIDHRDMKEKVTDQFEKMADTATDKFKSAAHGVEDAANRVLAQGGQASEGMQEVAGNIKGAVDRSVKDQPMATLAMAAPIGFVLGAIWKS